jgi:hypothetical protein
LIGDDFRQLLPVQDNPEDILLENISSELVCSHTENTEIERKYECRVQ